MKALQRSLGRLLLLFGLGAVVAWTTPTPGEDERLILRFCRLAGEDPGQVVDLGSGSIFQELLVFLGRHQQLHLRWCLLGEVEPLGPTPGAAAGYAGQDPRRWTLRPPVESRVQPVLFDVAGPPGGRRLTNVTFPEPAIRPAPIPPGRGAWF